MQKKFVGGFEMGGNDCYRFVKRAADVLFSFVLLALLYIPMLVISIAIRVSTGESSIFRQKSSPIAKRARNIRDRATLSLRIYIC